MPLKFWSSQAGSFRIFFFFPRRHPRQRIAIMGSIKTLIAQYRTENVFALHAGDPSENTAQIINVLNLFLKKKKEIWSFKNCDYVELNLFAHRISVLSKREGVNFFKEYYYEPL